MIVKIKKLHPDAVIPSYAHETDAGMDLTAIGTTIHGGTVVYNTGLSIEIPEGYVGLIFPRSSIRKYELRLTNSVGVIDSGFRGQIQVVFRTDHSSYPIKYNTGDRIAQLIIIPYPKIEFEEVQELEESTRGEKGFGSSGN